VTLNRKRRKFHERHLTSLALLQEDLRTAHEHAPLVARLRPRGGDFAASAAGRFGLTGRECDVALWLSHGKTNAEIAVILGMAPRTAEKHVESILRKLRVDNRTAAAVELSRFIGPDASP
jgi:DNA-binding CsgD family transcriptional regulator